LRILMISDVYFPRVNGVSTSIQTFREELAALGHEVQLIAPAYPAPARRDEAGVMRVPARKVPFDPEDRLMQWRAISALLPRLREQKFDLVHIQTPFVAHYVGLRIAKALGLPCVTTYHTFFEEYLHHYLPLLPAALTRIFARRFSRSQCNAVNAVIVPSKAMAQTLKQYGCATPMYIAPTGIPLEKFAHGDGAGFRARHGIAPGRPLLLNVGRVAHEKNIGFLIEMLELVRVRVPDVLLLICGEGPARPDLEQQVARMGLQQHVMFVGYLDRERELLDCYRAADVFVFASRTETQGLVLLEAMALGVPVVSTAAMGTVDIIAPQCGALMASEVPDEFSEKVVRLLKNPVLREALATDARSFAQSWSAPATAQRVEAIYAELLGKGRLVPELGAPGVAASSAG
jgi:1,2-diacylglycerol 3-alpha-glucosyltransferase